MLVGLIRHHKTLNWLRLCQLEGAHSAYCHRRRAATRVLLLARLPEERAVARERAHEYTPRASKGMKQFFFRARRFCYTVFTIFKCLVMSRYVKQPVAAQFFLLVRAL